MNRFIVLAVVIASAYGEAPLSGGYSGGGGAVTASRGSFGGSSGGSGLNEYVDQALLDRVAAVIESNGDGTAQGQDNEGDKYVDASIFSRVAQSLGGNGGSSRGASSAYGAPAPSGGDAMLGQPEPAMRIAEWDLSEAPAASSGGYSAPQQSSGGYQSAPAAPSGGYSQGPSRQQSSGPVSLGQPEAAQRVAEFEVNEQAQQGGNRGGQQGYSQGGYN